MPQILQGFGIDNAVIWRGFGGEDGHDKSEYWWQSPDGSQVFMIHLPRCGYCNALNLPSDIKRAAYRKIEQVRKEGLKRATTPYLLLMNGVDHVEPQPELSRIIRGVNQKLKGARPVHSRLPQYMKRVKSTRKRFPLVRGEFRRGLKHAGLLSGVLSTRMYLKQKNACLQTWLERWVEPFSTLAGVLTGEDYSASVRQAWRYLLQNHPHDSICGCSIDKVHRDMMTRFSWAGEIAEEVERRALTGIGSLVKFQKLSDQAEVVIVYNSQPGPVTDLVEAEIDFPAQANLTSITLYDHQGHHVPCSIERSLPG